MAKSRLKRPAEADGAKCHARELLSRVGDTWSVYVLHVLAGAETMRFNELRKQVSGISQRMLTVTLRGLERDGMVSRTVYPVVPPRVEYTLTPLGTSLSEPIRRIHYWAEEHIDEIVTAQMQYDARESSDN